MYRKPESSHADRYVSGVCTQPRQKVSKQISVLGAPVLRSGLALFLFFVFLFKSVHLVLCVHSALFVKHPFPVPQCFPTPVLSSHIQRRVFLSDSAERFAIPDPSRLSQAHTRDCNHRHPARSGSAGSRRGGRGLQRSESWVPTGGVGGGVRSVVPGLHPGPKRSPQCLFSAPVFPTYPYPDSLQTILGSELPEELPRATPANNFKAKEEPPGGLPGSSQTLGPASATTRARDHWT